jgi:hypothetical protein
MEVNCATANVPERRNGARRQELVARIRAEFREMPCLRLTCPQAQRLFGLRRDVCERVFAMLVSDRALTRGADGRYGVREGVGEFPGRTHALVS